MHNWLNRLERRLYKYNIPPIMRYIVFAMGGVFLLDLFLGMTTAYTYNAQGVRTAKTTAGNRRDFLLDGGTTEYYLYNAHGDVVQRTDSSGAVTKVYTYDAFGVEKDPDSADPNPFRYCGEYFDRETGAYYLRARYYSPETGRFTQEDPSCDGLN